jgi:putative phosphoserine phosphatase/1-acylglycerol-3-phosphate O-acyltransferase
VVVRQRSRADALLVAKLLRRDCRIVVDRDLAQDPVLGTIGRLIDVEFSRGVDELDAHRLREYRTLIAAGTSVVFLVGAIDRPDVVPALRSGPARLAAGAGVPIVPVVVRDSDALVTRRPPIVRPGTIHVDVRAPVTISADAERVREQLAAALA